MACVTSFWLQWGTLCSLLLFLFAQDISRDCKSKDDLLAEMSPDVALPSTCALDCTARTYSRVLESQDKRTVRFRDSYTERPEEYCWPTQIQCSSAQRLHNAFILVPVATTSSPAAVGLEVSSDARAERPRRHRGRALLPADCGLRFDVTQLLASKDRRPVLCVKVVPEQPGAPLTEGLRCPPFMVTTWEHWSQSDA
ncbi:hypothetical protein P4O66_016917 [Electrophorus voltai]|uniref:Interleukin-17 receptor C/E N-terminal domain-containing protein n=1 Tax=Electrophorus voltai TaxID=2609070 RepID=A0AAD9DQU8_9TELE|nr:hypothetical protein P4O66_016917 [Electrophorus voltai]